METSPLKARLRSLLDLARERQLAQVAGLSPSERDATGTLERWTAKDHLAHTIFWKEYMSERLAAAERGETPVLIPDFQPINEANFHVNRDRAAGAARRAGGRRSGRSRALSLAQG